MKNTFAVMATKSKSDRGSRAIICVQFFWALAIALVLVSRGVVVANGHYDVLIYGANAAGVAAAVTSSDGGKNRVLIVEPLQMIGGMAAAGGVALMNQGGCGLTGLSGNWSRIVSSLYGTKDRVTFPRMKESEVAFWSLLNATKNVETRLGCHALAVTSGEGCLGEIYFECDQLDDFSITASYVIDCSYDGDIMTLGNVDHTFGRESRKQYNESLAGVQIREFSDEESFAKQNITIAPFYGNGTLLKYVSPNPLGKDGDADNGLMSYEYFVCLSPTVGNQVPFSPPESYNPQDFILLLRQTMALVANGQYPLGPPLSYFGDVQCYDPVVENVTGNKDCLLCCGRGPVNSDQPNLNDGWAQGDFQTRRKMADKYKYYIKGSLYFLANDPRVPEFTRRDARRFGYCKDEYEDFQNFPPQLYVRVSNRLKGQVTLTQNNIVNPRKKRDGVAMGCWPFDQHTVKNAIFKSGTRFVLRNEGFFRAHIGSGKYLKRASKEPIMRGTFAWYDVPFGVMVPANTKQANNLLVPVCISASSVAYSSARIENMFMDLGSAAGVAIALLLEDIKNEMTEPKQSHRTMACPILAVQDSVDVSAVQNILSRVYRQRFHGPSPKTRLETRTS